ncbi:MAG TPA: helix-turn-helix domain-containing protein [Ktedonobacteraceae bacterium]|jgi:excisionase family DNA binding protein|nr:helix-turn-helix domain-containing protein [Ktedonobacteraceae bacterium]
MSNEDTLLTAEDVARIVKVSIRTVRRWVAAGQIEIVEIGKQDYRITREALKRFIQERQKRRGNAETENR